jgi:hypothetical protein
LRAIPQVLYGSYPIARCRDPYAVIRYLAAHAWPRLHLALGLRKEDTEQGSDNVVVAAAVGDGSGSVVATQPQSADKERTVVELADEQWSPLGEWECDRDQ